MWFTKTGLTAIDLCLQFPMVTIVSRADELRRERFDDGVKIDQITRGSWRVIAILAQPSVTLCDQRLPVRLSSYYGDLARFPR